VVSITQPGLRELKPKKKKKKIHLTSVRPRETTRRRDLRLGDSAPSYCCQRLVHCSQTSCACCRGQGQGASSPLFLLVFSWPEPRGENVTTASQNRFFFSFAAPPLHTAHRASMFPHTGCHGHYSRQVQVQGGMVGLQGRDWK